MSKATFCPHLIIDIKMTTPEEVEDNYIIPLCSFLEYIEEEKVPCYFPREIFINFLHEYPWNMTEDDRWNKHLNLWHMSLTQQLNKITLIDVTKNQQTNLEFKRCNNVNGEHQAIFEEFLKDFGTKSLSGRKSEESIFSPSPTCCEYDDFIQIKSEYDYKKSVYSWYKLYPMTLPCRGDKYFIPPHHWKNSPKVIHGPSGGYFDRDGREWIWDKMHNDHWDVQLEKPARGKYDKVTPDGLII